MTWHRWKRSGKAAASSSSHLVTVVVTGLDSVTARNHSYHALLVQSMIVMQELPQNTTPLILISSRRSRVTSMRSSFFLHRSL